MLVAVDMSTHVCMHVGRMVGSEEVEYSLAVNRESCACCRNLSLSHFVTFNESYTPLFSYVLNGDTNACWLLKQF